MSPLGITLAVVGYVIALVVILTIAHRMITGRRLAEAQQQAEQNPDAVDDPDVEDSAWLHMLRHIHDDDEAAAAEARRKKETP